jgi:hypothetical protein
MPQPRHVAECGTPSSAKVTVIVAFKDTGIARAADGTEYVLVPIPKPAYRKLRPDAATAPPSSFLAKYTQSGDGCSIGRLYRHYVAWARERQMRAAHRGTFARACVRTYGASASIGGRSYVVCRLLGEDELPEGEVYPEPALTEDIGHLLGRSGLWSTTDAAREIGVEPKAFLAAARSIGLAAVASVGVGGERFQREYLWAPTQIALVRQVGQAAVVGPAGHDAVERS